MHDLLHDVATSVMEHELHLIQPGGSLDGAKNCRHVSYSTEVKEYGTLMKEIPLLRSFVFVRKHSRWFGSYSVPRYYHANDVVEWLSSQKHLRILRLDGKFEKLPMSLSKHLRYLDVSGSFIKRLPESTSSLHKLQTLNLRFCKFLEQLPKGMKEMKSLVYLDIKGCDRLKRMPPGMGQLKGMRKLSNFMVGKKDGYKIGELKELNGLEGELSISGFCDVKSVADFKSANLMEKKMLTSLELDGSIDVEALSLLQPHQNLRKLIIRGYGSLELPDWMMDHNVCSLETLRLYHCPILQSLPSARLWCSSSLRILDIWFCGELITLSDDGLRHLTALQELHLIECPKMTLLPESIQHLTTLVKLAIRDCPVLERRCEKGKGEDWPKIAHIPSVFITWKQIQENEEEEQQQRLTISFL